MATSTESLPPRLREALTTPPPGPKPWANGVAPAYISLFLWIVFFDALPKRTVTVGGLGWSLIGAAMAGLLCFAFVYLPMAAWGRRTGRPLAVLGASTFGTSGSLWLPGLLMGVVQLVWFALTIAFAADLAQHSLQTVGLVKPAELAPVHLGGWTLPSRAYLVATLIWSVTAAVLGTLLMRVVAAVMYSYMVFPALALGGAMLLTLGGVGGFRPYAFDPTTAEPVRNGGLAAVVAMIQLIFAFFATPGAMAADWGAACRDDRDVQLGGLVGVALAPWVVAALALLTVAGSVGTNPPPPGLAGDLAAQGQYQRLLEAGAVGPRVAKVRDEVRAIAARDFTVHAVLRYRVGGPLGFTLLTIFALGTLGPICYAVMTFSRRFHEAVPRLPRWAWGLVGAVVVWPWVATGGPLRIELLFGWLGAAMAPVVGAMGAESVRHRGQWPGPRRGFNLAGVVAWMVGLAVGLVPYLFWPPFQPAAVYAFAAAFVTYWLLAALGLEPAPVAGG